VLTVWRTDTSEEYDVRLAELGASNLRIRTSNRLSPHLFPEFITEWRYYYAAAPRPGFMGRFLIGEDGVSDPGWHTSPNDFGKQAGASANGDLPGDIYRLLGGVVLRQEGTASKFAGYLASAFLLPKDTNNNRIVAPGSEPVPGPDGTSAHAWLVGTRPGMLFETGTSFRPVVQIDPILPAAITFTLCYPDGRTRLVEGTGDTTGSFVGPEAWILDIPGVYEFRIEGEWNGYPARVPGLPATGGRFYVMDATRPAGAPEMVLELPAESTFNIEDGLEIVGRTTAPKVHYAALIPGAVIDQGELPVENGRFRYHFDALTTNRKFPIYDTLNGVAFWPEVMKIVHLSFFAGEIAADGGVHHSFSRVILRGNRVMHTQ
jgi:hypothetical protein